MTRPAEGWLKGKYDRKYHHYAANRTSSTCGGVSRFELLEEEPGPAGPCEKCLAALERETPEPIWMEDGPGFTFFPRQGATRLEMECQHQHGLLYITEGAEGNWVCSRLRRPAHSLAGFFRELGELQDGRVRELMQRWGLYYRGLPLVEANEPLEVEDANAEPRQNTSIPVRAATGDDGDAGGEEGQSTGGPDG